MLLLHVCHIWLCVESKRCSRENQLYSMRLTQYKSHIFKWIVNDVKKVFFLTSGKKVLFQLCDAHGKNWNMSINIDFKLKNHWWIIFFFSLINSSNDVVSDEMKNVYFHCSNVFKLLFSPFWVFVYVIMMIVMLYAVVYNVMPFRGGFILFFYFILLVICQWRTATLF